MKSSEHILSSSADARCFPRCSAAPHRESATPVTPKCATVVPAGRVRRLDDPAHRIASGQSALFLTSMDTCRCTSSFFSGIGYV
eukprot:6183364-Pleurochrysis_carterae.AAC.1